MWILLARFKTEQEMSKIRRDFGCTDSYVQNFHRKYFEEFLIRILKVGDSI